MLITTQFTTTGSYGSAQKFYANTSDTSPLQLTTTGAIYTEKYLRMDSGSSLTNSTLFCEADNSGYGYAQLQLQSGTISLAPRVILQQYVDYSASPSFGVCNNKLDMNGNTLTITNGNVSQDLPENSITMNYVIPTTDTNIKIRSADDYSGFESYIQLGIYTYGLDITIQGQEAITIAATSSVAPIVVRRNISLTTFDSGGTSCGILQKSTINTTTTGSTTLTTASAFTTIINTPSASGRIFVLPAPTAGTIGYWYAFVNKSTANIITINSSVGVAQITIPAGLAGGAGGYGKVAVDSAGSAYFRCGG